MEQYLCSFSHLILSHVRQLNLFKYFSTVNFTSYHLGVSAEEQMSPEGWVTVISVVFKVVV